MKTTIKPCFSNGTEFMWWQDVNCCHCKKAVWYNEKLDRYPKYKCAVQRDIEAQAAGIDEINVRSYEAARQSRCPFIKYADAPKEQKEILDFSKGESFVKGMPLFNQGNVQSDALSSNQKKIEHDVKVEQKAEEKPPEKVENPIDPELFRIARQNGIDYEALKNAERRVQSDLAVAHSPFLQSVSAEERFKQDVHNGTCKMLDTFTWRENMMIAFMPLVIFGIAWHYADNVMKRCAEMHIKETKLLTRAVKEIRKEYTEQLKLDLNFEHINRIERQIKQFMGIHVNDFTQLWYSVKNEYMRIFPDDPLLDMRTDAYVTILMCRFLVEHNKRMDKIISAKLGQSASIQNPLIGKLVSCMDAYCGDEVIKDNMNIELSLKVLQNRIDEIEFVVDDNDPGK